MTDCQLCIDGFVYDAGRVFVCICPKGEPNRGVFYAASDTQKKRPMQWPVWGERRDMPPAPTTGRDLAAGRDDD